MNHAIGKFAHDEDGAVIAFVIVLFLVMFVASGMAIDFMRHETARSDLQNALDRGVLAAADLTQTAQTQDGVDEKRIVSDYMKSHSFSPNQVILNVRTPNIGLNARRIEADATYKLNTHFIKLIGFPELQVRATAAAEQRQTDTEVSLVLDVSGSMNWQSSDNSGVKLVLLKAAAKEFVDTVLTDETRDRTAISIVPYAGRSPISPDLATRLNMETHHDLSHCIEWSEDDFLSTDLSSTTPRVAGGVFDDDEGSYRVADTNGDGVEPNDTGRLQQAQHFWLSTYWQERSCYPDHGFAFPFSNDNADLHAAIDALVARGSTATYNGVRTAAMFLDPDMRPVVEGMISDNLVDANLSGWPRDWNVSGVRKVVVIMSDGQNTKFFKVPNAVYNTKTPDMWETVDGYPYRVAEVDNVASLDILTEMGEGDDRMHDICATLRAQGALVYTVGYELGTASSRPARALAACANSSSQSYLANGLQISDAFRSIAADIKKLKLAQ